MPNNDYILRRDVLNEFHEWIVSNDGNIFSLADALEVIPAADVEPVRHGYWINLNNGQWAQYMVEQYKCSVCGREVIGRTKRCEECGAKMDAEPPKEERN